MRVHTSSLVIMLSTINFEMISSNFLFKKSFQAIVYLQLIILI